MDDVEEPHAGMGEVVVGIKAAGVCHSDVSTLDDPGWMAFYHRVPIALGHENAGVILEVGDGMEKWKVGDRVGLAPMMDDTHGLGSGDWDGGFGEQLIAKERNLVALPDEVPFDMGAVATDAGLTAYHAMVAQGGAKKGMKIGVIGLGGLGYVGARVAVLLGAEVYGADVSPSARGLANEIGLAGVGESIEEFTDKGLELVVDYAGFGVTSVSALNALSRSGTLVQVGMGKLDIEINTFPLITKQLMFKGSVSGTKEDLAALYELMRSGDLNPPINRITQAEIPDAIEKLRVGGVVGRFVALYDN